MTQTYDLAIPILPSRSIDASVAFYRRLGFEGGAHDFNNSYAILRRGWLREFAIVDPDGNLLRIGQIIGMKPLHA